MEVTMTKCADDKCGYRMSGHCTHGKRKQKTSCPVDDELERVQSFGVIKRGSTSHQQLHNMHLEAESEQWQQN